MDDGRETSIIFFVMHLIISSLLLSLSLHPIFHSHAFSLLNLSIHNVDYSLCEHNIINILVFFPHKILNILTKGKRKKRVVHYASLGTDVKCTWPLSRIIFIHVEMDSMKNQYKRGWSVCVCVCLFVCALF